MNKYKLIIIYLTLTVFFSVNLSTEVWCQTHPPTSGLKGPKSLRKDSPADRNFYGDTSEKSLAVDERVNVQLCVVQGNLKINGWERNEVRVFVNEGSKIGFKVLQESSKPNGKPVWIKITGYTVKNKHSQSTECLSGNEIEIDVPINAAINVKGEEIETSIDSIRKVVIKNTGGDISLRNITEGINALTYQGDVMVENSNGSITLESATGNIVAFEAAPSQIGDIFKAKSNSGTISLQKLEHRQIDVNSISGSILFNGKVLSGGMYSFTTSKGAITLAIPQDSSCKIVALYGYGSLHSEIPLKYLTEEIGEQVKRVVAQMGAGDATVNLTTTNGSIRIKKQ